MAGEEKAAHQRQAIAKADGKAARQRNQTNPRNAKHCGNDVEFIWAGFVNRPKQKRHQNAVNCRQKGVFSRCCVRYAHGLGVVRQKQHDSDNAAAYQIVLVENFQLFMKNQRQQKAGTAKTNRQKKGWRPNVCYVFYHNE